MRWITKTLHPFAPPLVPLSNFRPYCGHSGSKSLPTPALDSYFCFPHSSPLETFSFIYTKTTPTESVFGAVYITLALPSRKVH